MSSFHKNLYIKLIEQGFIDPSKIRLFGRTYDFSQYFSGKEQPAILQNSSEAPNLSGKEQPAILLDSTKVSPQNLSTSLRLTEQSMSRKPVRPKRESFLTIKGGKGGLLWQ